MNTHFTLLDKSLTLVRYPAKHQHKSLQAWDSADELLIEHVCCERNTPEPQHCLILNDDFGALGCFFAAANPVWVSDSVISHCSLARNLAANYEAVSTNDQHIVQSPVRAQDSLAPFPDAPQLVLIKIPRTLALLEQQLRQLQGVMTPQTHIIASAKVKTITRSVLQLFEKYIGVTTTSLAKKKSRLVFATPCADKCGQAQPVVQKTWTLQSNTGQPLKVSNHANVFSRQSLDIGARVMLEHMQVSNNDTVIDLGCGNGVLGLQALALAPEAEVTFVDESFMAVASAKDNVMANFPAQIDQCRFVASNCLEQLLPEKKGTFSKVLCNPPFHQQNVITDHIAWQMFHDARESLRIGGHLIVVANRHLDYPTTLKRLFGGVTILASHNKFVIYSAAKRQG